MIESATLISTSAGIEQRRDATRALTEGPDQEGRTVIRSPGSRRMTWDGKKAINPGGLGAKSPLRCDLFLYYQRDGRCCCILAAEDELPSDGSAPLRDPSLQRSHLARREGIR
jgi:hypothetical protein